MTGFNSGAFNTIPFDAYGDTITVVELGVETVCAVEQLVGVVKGVETVLQLEQEIILEILCPVESVCDIEQQVQFEEDSLIILSVEQRVINLSLDKFLVRNGWNIDLTIDGQEIGHQFIHDNITITLEENQANLCEFTLLPSDPIPFIDTTWGKSVTIDYYTETESIRLFTGLVDIPEIDLIEKKVKLKCSNRRDELINNTLSGQLPTIGRYSVDVFGKVNDTLEEFNYRLSTIPCSADFDSYNTFNLNSWYAKDVADYTYTAADIYYRQPNLTWQSRTKIVNNINIDLSYQFTRLYHHQRSWHWRAPFADSLCNFLQNQYSLLNIQMVMDAIEQAGWRLQGSIVFESLWPPGICTDGAQILVWQSLFTRGSYTTKFDDSGNVVSDPDGNNIYNFNGFSAADDLSTVYTLAADWTATTRFSQYVKENYVINVKAPQSISQFGDVFQNDSTAVEQDFDASAWEDYRYETAIPANAVSSAGGYYSNQDTNPNALFNAQQTCIDKAKTEILSTHRDTQLEIEMPIKPHLQLKHTVKYDSSRITAKGKVSRIVHKLDVNEGKDCTTTANLSLFRSQGTSSTTGTRSLPRLTDSLTIPNPAISLPSQYGVEPTTATIGYIGNKNNPRVAGTPFRTDIQEEFRVDTPNIPDALRKLRPLTGSTNTFTVEIPNDLLEVDFND